MPIAKISQSIALPFCLIAFLVVLHVHVGESECPPSQNGQQTDLTLAEMVLHSDIVALGQVVGRHNSTDKSSANAVEMEIMCVYKGGSSIPLRINISEPISSVGKCYFMNFTVGERLLTYLHHEKGHYTPVYAPNPENWVDEIFIICGITVEIPEGAGDTECEDYKEFDEQDCITVSPKAVPPATRTVIQEEIGDDADVSYAGVKSDEVDKDVDDNEEDDRDDDPNASNRLHISLAIISSCLLSVLMELLPDL